MSSFNPEAARGRACWLVLALLAAGCSASHPCASSESCNQRDDDCDGQIDEDFVDERGRYVQDEHCGRCDLACDGVFPSASATRCDASAELPVCRLVACPPGTHQAGESACVPDQPVLCLPCAVDADCSALLAGARCVESAGDQRCGLPCDADTPCPAPFQCDAALGQCTPDPGLCACEGVEEGFEVACLATGAAVGISCAGVQRCEADGLGECRIASSESCDGEDDDCDGESDEDFLDAEGRYVGRLHCGACGNPCVAPGPNYDAECLGSGADVHCEVACTPGFVDVDGIRGNGCECQIFDGTSAPVVVGGDANCDGIIDDDSTFVHVTSAGNDSEPGTLVRPMRTIAAAVARAQAEHKAVLVAQGSYDAFEIVSGVSVFGGYRSDFRDRNPELYPVYLDPRGARDGAPALSCRGVQGTAVVDGITIVGGDAETPGRGSSAVFFDGCGGSVRLRDVTVLSGRGADGRPGDDASQRLPPGVNTLAELAGSDAAPGRDGDAEAMTCMSLAGGAAGPKVCGGLDVSGGHGGAAACAETGCTNGAACANAGCTDFTRNGVCDYDAVLALAVPNPAAGSGRGAAPGAAGAATYNAPTNRGTCEFCDDNPTLARIGQDGSDGAPGADGSAGAGCRAGVLAIDANGRAAGGAGSPGTSGGDGSGGGGGSAGSGYDVIGNTAGVCDDSAGGSGGGGGSGGCGSPSGGGGLGGGSSLGIVVRTTPAGEGPTFEGVRVVTASGGRGGDGGIGAAGGVGGRGAQGGRSRFWCARNGGRGGDGGAGGSGGGGGGGCGGASHAVYLVGDVTSGYRAALESTLTIELAGVAGQGGRGGFSPGFSGGAGEAGASDPVR